MSRRVGVAGIALAIAAAAIRMPNLRDLPIFGDEAIFLRLARLVLGDVAGNLWLPLQMPNPPFHPWLLASSLPLSSDPVRAGRLLSVLFGAVLAPSLAWAVWRAGAAFGWDRARCRVAALAAGALTAVSPFFVFAQRIVRLDALFALEVALCIGFSLELAGRARSGRPLAAGTLAFGALMGATMLTRQAVSYPLWAFPAVAFLLIPGRGGAKRFAVSIGVALAIAAALWIPMLLAPAWPDLKTRLFHVAIARPPLSFPERVALLARNGALAATALWTYLTPPVALAAIAGAAFLALRHRRLFGLLAAGHFLLLVPALLFAADYFPRYALPASLPLLAAAAFGFGALWPRARAETAVLFLAVVSWGAVEIARGETDWRRWRLLPVDRRQFVSGWSAGRASEGAAAFLARRARERPISVVVPHVSGNPADAIWLLLEKEEDVRLFYAQDFLRLPASAVRGDVWTGGPPTALDRERPVFFVSQDPVFLGREGWAPAWGVVPPLNPGARLVARFENPPDEQGKVESAVTLFRLR